MTIWNYFNKRIRVLTLKNTGFKSTLHSTGTIDGHVQRIGEENDAVDVGVFGGTHKCWVDISEKVKDGDRVIIDDLEYEVVATSDKGQDFAMNLHKELILRIYNNSDNA